MSEILSKAQIDQFIYDGYIRIDEAFSAETASAALDILWDDLPYDRSDPDSWTEPVIRLGLYTQTPFMDSVNNDRLHRIFDHLVGADRWLPCRSVGTFPVRFPADKEPNDTGKHVDASFPGNDPGNFFEWRINIRSKGRALLMLVLYSDVSELDAPTIIYKGSHIDVARVLKTEGEQGLSFMELAGKLDSLPKREEALAVGSAGTVYLCHPFLVHAAQQHRGRAPKFMAQPPLVLKEPLEFEGSGTGYTPVEEAIRLALENRG
jgi:hypothetical protein